MTKYSGEWVDFRSAPYELQERLAHSALSDGQDLIQVEKLSTGEIVLVSYDPTAGLPAYFSLFPHSGTFKRNRVSESGETIVTNEPAPVQDYIRNPRTGVMEPNGPPHRGDKVGAR